MAGSSQLQWIIGATDNASKVLAGIGKELDKTTTKTDRLRQASQLLGGVALLGFAATSIKAYADAEQSQMKLQEAYRKFPKIADVSIQSFQELNQALQDKAGADADDLAAGEAKLAMFDLTGNQIKQLIPLVNDLAINQGIGLTEASELVGKAMLGNAKALKSLGIEFKATGDKAKDYATISDLLAEKVGGTGVAFDKTAQGAMLKAQRTFGDLQEEVGKQLVPALSAVANAVLPVLRAFNGLSDSLKGPIVWIAAASAAALVLGPRLLSMGANLRLIFPDGIRAALGLKAVSAAEDEVASKSHKASGQMGGLGRAMKGLGVAGAALAVGLPLVGQLTDAIGKSMFGAAPSAEDLSKAINGITQGADANKIGNFGVQLHGLGAELEHLDNPGLMQRIEDFFSFFNGGGQGRKQVLRDLALINDAIATMASSGDIVGARRALDALEKAALDAGTSAGAVAEDFKVAEDAISAANRASSATAGGLDDLSASADGASGSAKTFADRMTEVVHGMHDWYAGGNLVAATEKRLAAETAAHTAAVAHQAHVAAAAHAAQVAAANAALTTWNESITAYTNAKDALTALTDARAQEVKAIGDQLTASGHLNSVFDTNAYTAATDRAKTARLGLADAEKAVRDARNDVGKAKTPEELNGAINAEAQANKALAASRAEVAAADKAKAAAALTPGNLLAGIKSKLSNIKSFYNDLVALRKRKLPMSLIKQLIDAGPIEGDQLAKALLSATPSDFNAIINAEAQLDRVGRDIGTMVGDYDYNGLITRQTGVVNNARANAIAAGNQVAQFRLYLDGREVAVALKAYRASVGGTPLGLG